MFEIGDVVCFRENHEWVCCIGFVNEIKNYKSDNAHTLRLMIGVPAPKRGVAYIFATPDEVENLNCTVKYPYEVI